ncbi:hypothetical protein F0344_18675 [Streptomyces finlayi]|uniref:Dipeptidylpeptidase IV N-terminal domain-containing protein n=1 Tax=Streptomyces finlayi TaxID=67296 RepID=A0A7G7BM16_9ACTN|nr:PD40 domain-containing protein [Streptomyces finlayi]QNE76381.1 hypothetical protein F0344_18675 [Streptomyces finlayi]
MESAARAWPHPGGAAFHPGQPGGASAVHVATGAVTELQSHWTTSLSSIQGPVFSPDGTRIAFCAMDDFDHTHSTYAVDAAGGKNLQVLTDQAVTPTDWLNR